MLIVNGTTSPLGPPILLYKLIFSKWPRDQCEAWVFPQCRGSFRLGDAPSGELSNLLPVHPLMEVQVVRLTPMDLRQIKKSYEDALLKG